MSQAFAQPTPDPEHSPLGAEFEAQTNLLAFLHHYYEGARGDDKTLQRSIGERATALAVTPVPPVEPKLFVELKSNEAVLRRHTYDEMQWQPRPGTDTASRIDRILVRFPLIDDPEYGQYAGENGTVSINDVLIQIGEHRYLLNDQGVVPYADGESLKFDDREIVDANRHPSDRPNAYRIEGEYAWQAPHLTAVELHKMLLEDSHYTQHEAA